MSPAFAQAAVRRLRLMTVTEADRFLCASHTDDLHAIGEALGIRLPIRGGDKPCIIIGALGLVPTSAVSPHQRSFGGRHA